VIDWNSAGFWGGAVALVTVLVKCIYDWRKESGATRTQTVKEQKTEADRVQAIVREYTDRAYRFLEERILFLENQNTGQSHELTDLRAQILAVKVIEDECQRKLKSLSDAHDKMITDMMARRRPKT
jgi:uncharacterized coiled-coil protein SlyX